MNTTGAYRPQNPVSLWRKNFERWDRNGDGKIAHNEMRRNIADREIQGDDAAALATLRDLLEIVQSSRGLKNLASLTRRRLDNISTWSEDGYQIETLKDSFEKGKAKIEAHKELLYSKDHPDLAEAEQGKFGTCGFLSPLYQLADKDPEAAANMISDPKDGRYAVKFQGVDSPVYCEPLTDTEIALHSSSPDGAWLPMVEKAWTRLLEKDKFSYLPRKQSNENYGISTHVPIGPLTGNPVEQLGLTNSTSDNDLERVRQAIEAGAIITVGSKADLKLDGLMPGHGYGLVGWDESKKEFELRNTSPRVEPKDETGRARDGSNDGLFTVSISELKENFDVIAWESGDRQAPDVQIPEWLKTKISQVQTAKGKAALPFEALDPRYAEPLRKMSGDTLKHHRDLDGRLVDQHPSPGVVQQLDDDEFIYTLHEKNGTSEELVLFWGDENGQYIPGGGPKDGTAYYFQSTNDTISQFNFHPESDQVIGIFVEGQNPYMDSSTAQ